MKLTSRNGLKYHKMNGLFTFTCTWETPGRLGYLRIGGKGEGEEGGGEAGSKPGCPYNLLIYLDHVDMIDGVTRLGGLPGLLVRVSLSSGVTICIVKVSR